MNLLSSKNSLVSVLFEDNRLLAVVKPAGVDVGGLPNQKVSGLVELLSASRGRHETLQPINRLSRYESGVLVLAKSPQHASAFRTELKNERIEHEYLAVVLGRMSKGKLILDGRREEKTGRRPPHERQVSRDRRGRRPGPNPPSAASNATQLIRVEEGEKRTLVRCQTRVGTTHALRAQLRSAGLRLLGDPLHDRSARPTAHRETCLHLSIVRWPASTGDKPLTFRAPAPPEISASLRGERNVHRALHAALVRRMGCIQDPHTDAFRLLTGPVEDVPGLVVEKFGPVLLFQLLEPPSWLTTSLKSIAQWYAERLDIRAVYVKRYVKNRQRSDFELEASLHSAQPFLGKAVEPQIEIRENGLRFGIRPYDGYSVGLFLDQRDNRRRVRDLAAGKRVLNLFAYTSGFSVAAAVGGAAQTVSVDVAVKNLEWGKQNFLLNGVDLENHLFFRSDAAEFLARMKRQDKLFDLVVLDPPSFAHGKGSKRDFSVLDDLSGLVRGAVDVLAPDGVLMVSTNHRKMTLRGLLDRVRRGAGPRGCEVLETPPLPADFAVDADHAKTVVVRLTGGCSSSPVDEV